MKFWPSRERQVAVDVTYLKLCEPPLAPNAPSDDVRVIRADQATAGFYRFLYDQVGRDWQWYERLRMDDAALLKAIRAPGIEIDVLHVAGVPAGYVELNFGSGVEVEVMYFGLMREFIGRGFGSYFLRWMLHRAWQISPQRVWLHTCSLDHPRALGEYQKAGMQIYRTERIYIADPRSQFPHLDSP